jgi:hypothetical protein
VLENVGVNVFSGPKLSIDNVTGTGLEGAARLIATDRPPPVEATSPAYQLGMGSGPPN